VCLGDCAHHAALHRFCPERCLELSSRSTFKKYYHFLMYSLFLVFAFAISYVCLNPQVAALLPKIPMIHGSCEEKSSLYCYGVNTIYRISFALTVFFVLHLVLSLGRCFYLNCYVARWLGFFALSAAAVWIPGIAIKVFAWISMPMAAIFLVMMNVIWVDFAYEWHQTWTNRKNRIWIGVLNALAVLFTLGSIVLLILEFVFFNCAEAQALISVNFVLGFACYLLPLLIDRVHYLPVSVIVLYNTYILFQGLSYGLGLESGCYYRKVDTSDMDNPIAFSTVFDTFLTLISLIWTAFSIANNHSVFSLRERDYSSNIFYQEETEPIGTGPNPSEEDVGSIVERGPDLGSSVVRLNGGETLQPSETDRAVTRFRFFFFVMVIATCYMLMTLSSWQIYGHTVRSRIDSGRTSMYIKLASTYFCYAMFVLFSILPTLDPIQVFD
jgi:hypothetical protein